jgi:hypothetical protein
MILYQGQDLAFTERAWMASAKLDSVNASAEIRFEQAAVERRSYSASRSVVSTPTVTRLWQRLTTQIGACSVTQPLVIRFNA